MNLRKNTLPAPIHFEVVNTDMKDLPLIHSLFEHSIVYQERKGYPVWKDYDRKALEKDIQNGNQYKIVAGSAVAMVFSVAYRDKIIWRELDKGESVYLHRIVIHPDFKGMRLFGRIVQWAIGHIRARGLKSIRMDTWAANPTIIDYYKSFGFRVIGNYTTPDSPELPVHNRNLPLTLLEYQGGNFLYRYAARNEA